MFFLKNHPFAVEAFFKTSIVLTFAIPKDKLKNLIPECLELDTFKDEWAFIAVACVDTKDLRLKGFPKFMGNDFFLIGFRIFVRYTNNKGKKLRGLYILKSETDKSKMELFGNIFTHYKYLKTDINFCVNGDKIKIQSHKSGLEIELNIKDENMSLPVKSPFKDWKEARRFAGPLPFTFSYNDKRKEVVIIEGVRENWMPKPLKVNKCNIDFINQKTFKGIILANAFMIENIPYYWKKGKIETWEG